MRPPVVAGHQADHEQHLPDKQRERILELRRQEPEAGDGTRRRRAPALPASTQTGLAAVERGEDQRAGQQQHHVEAHDVELPGAELQQEDGGQHLRRHRELEEGFHPRIEVVGPAGPAVPGPAGALVHEGGERVGLEEWQQRDQEDADQDHQRRDVQLAGPAGCQVHHRAEIVLDPGPVDHAHHQPGEQHEQLGAGDEAHRLLGQQLEQRCHAQVVDHHEDNGQAAEQVHPGIPLGGVAVAPGRDQRLPCRGICHSATIRRISWPLPQSRPQRPARVLAVHSCRPAPTSVTGPVTMAGPSAGLSRQPAAMLALPVIASRCSPHPVSRVLVRSSQTTTAVFGEFVRCGGRQDLVPPGPLDVRFRSAAGSRAVEGGRLQHERLVPAGGICGVEIFARRPAVSIALELAAGGTVLTAASPAVSSWKAVRPTQSTASSPG